MTKARFILSVKELVRDTGYGRSNAITRFAPTEINRVATYCRTKTLEYLIKRAEMSDTAAAPFRDRPGRLTLSKLVKTATGTHDTNVPSDFFWLICGRTTAGKYMPKSFMDLGEGFHAHGEQQIWVRDGKFKGTADTAVYYGAPTEVIESSVAQFTEFPDAFYNAVAFKTAAELIHSEPRNTERAKAYAEIFENMVVSLQ